MRLTFLLTYELAITAETSRKFISDKKNRNAVSKDLTGTIATRYPNITKVWLTTGEGAMLFLGRKKQG